MGFDPMMFEEALHDICQGHGLSAVYLFGSPGRTQAAGPGDAQVGLVFRDPTGPEEITAIHPKLLGAFRELLGAAGVSLIYLQQVGPLLQYQGILGRLLYSADAARRADFEDRVVRDYLDFAFEMRLFDEEFAEEMDRESGSD